LHKHAKKNAKKKPPKRQTTREAMYHITLRRVLATIVAIKKQ